MFSVLHKRQRGEYVRARIARLFDHYASQVRTLLAPVQVFFHGYYARVLPVLRSLYYYVVFL